MATEREVLEFLIKAETADTVRRLGEVEAKLRGLGAQSTSTGANWAQMTTAIGSAISIVQQVAGAIGSVVDGLRDMSTQMETQIALLNNFTGNIGEAQERTHGLFSRMQLMTAANRAATAGLQLTGHQLATLAVAADNLADAMGTNNVEAMNSMVQAMATGRTMALAPLGIDLEGITDRGEKTAEAMRQLEERFGTMSAETDTLGGSFEQLDATWEDLKLSFFEGFDAADGLKEAFAELGVQLGELASFFGADLQDPMQEVAELAAVVAAGVELMVRRIGAMADAVRLFAAGDFEGAGRASEAAVGTNPLDEMSESYLRTMRNWTQRRIARETGGGEGVPAVSAEDGGADGGGGGGAGRRGPTKDELVAQEFERSALGQFESMGSGTVGLFSGLAEGFGGEGLADDFIEPLEEGTAAAEEMKAALDEAGESMRTMAEIGGQVGNVLLDVFERGPQKALKSFAESFGKRMFLQAMEQVAMAIGASIMNPPDAAAHWASAAAFGAAAGAAGGASAALSTGGAGGGGASPQRSDVGGGGRSGGGGTIVINYNSPVPEALIGREQRRADRAARRRFGA